MSANLLAEGDRRTGADGTTYADGVWSIPANGTSKEKYAATDWLAGTEAVSGNQTLHVGLSVRAASGASVVVLPGVGYVDAAGHVKYVATRVSARGTGAWQRVEGSLVMPSGMRVSLFFVHQGAGGAALKLTAPCLSYGSPVCLASSAHTPYATQDHVAAEYATKAALKVTSDAVTAEVEERGKLAGRVGTLESTSGTHTSKLEQLAASIKSLVKGESTYTDPDGKSATSGIYSLVTQTRDSVTALFGSYTKTEDLASTQAVKDAKKAGTDAQAAASAAQTTADSAKSTAQTAASDAATAKTTATSAANTASNASKTAQDAKKTADGISVGGRNLVLGTGVAATWTAPTIAAGSFKAWNSYDMVAAWSAIGVKAGDPLTLTFDWAVTGAPAGATFSVGTNANPWEFFSLVVTLAAGSSSGHVAKTVAAPSGLPTSTGSKFRVRIDAVGNAIAAGMTVTLSHVKIERGNKATDWTPAPEDVDAAIGTAQTTADSAQTTANSAKSTASTAKSTADSLATLIRADSTGITVGKSADGQTWSTGRTRMTASAFQVLDKAGTTVAQLAADGASFLSGLVRIVAGKVSLPGADSVDSITIDAGGGVAIVSGLISRLSGLYNGISSTVTAGFDSGNGITATVRDTKSNIVANAILHVDKATVGIGGQHVTMKGDAFELSNPEYLLSALMDTSKVPESLDTCGPGVFSYDTSTAGRPTSYGTCVCIRAGDGTTSTWLFQLALPTVGDPHWRRNINGAGWTSWWVITSQ